MSADPQPHLIGHPHVWGRTVSRRQLIGTALGVTGVALTSGIWQPGRAHAAVLGGADPKPIPGGITHPLGFFIHHYPPVSGNEPSQISDFDGVVANTRLTGSGMATDTSTGAIRSLVYQVDNGFMDGQYVGMDGQLRRGTFGYI